MECRSKIGSETVNRVHNWSKHKICIYSLFIKTKQKAQL